MPKKCQELGCDTTVARADHGPLNWCEQHARERGFRLMQCPVCSRKDWIRGGGAEDCAVCLRDCGQSVMMQVLMRTLPGRDSSRKQIPAPLRMISRPYQWWHPARSKKHFEEGEQLIVARLVLEEGAEGKQLPVWRVEVGIVNRSTHDTAIRLSDGCGSYHLHTWSDISWYIKPQDLRCTLPEIPGPCSPDDQPFIDNGVLGWLSKGTGVERGETVD